MAAEGSASGSPEKVGMVEERCPICLDDFHDKAFITSCFHSYCFECVVRAARASGARCPMCKKQFNKVIHNVRANDDYDMYTIPPVPAMSIAEARHQTMQDLEEALRHFRGYRTTNRGRSSSNRTSGSSSSGHGSRGSRAQDWPDQGHVHVHISVPGSVSVSSSSSSGGGGGGGGRGRGGQGAEHVQRFGWNVRRSERCAPASFRRAVYSAGVHALPLEESGRGHRHRTNDISAAYYKRNPARTHRLGPWLSREFEVLVGAENVEFMMQLVLSLVDKVDLESEYFASHLEPFLNERTAHFMHEFVSFARSPYDVIAYDGRVRYDWPRDYPVPPGPPPPPPPGRRGRGGGGTSQSEDTGPGPSTSSVLDEEWRQRVLQEVLEEGTEEGHDESCFIVENRTSPIVIHDSDSEPELGAGASQPPIQDPPIPPPEGLDLAPDLENRSVSHQTVPSPSPNVGGAVGGASSGADVTVQASSHVGVTSLEAGPSTSAAGDGIQSRLKEEKLDSPEEDESYIRGSHGSSKATPMLSGEGERGEVDTSEVVRRSKGKHKMGAREGDRHLKSLRHHKRSSHKKHHRKCRRKSRSWGLSDTEEEGEEGEREGEEGKRQRHLKKGASVSPLGRGKQYKRHKHKKRRQSKEKDVKRERGRSEESSERDKRARKRRRRRLEERDIEGVQTSDVTFETKGTSDADPEPVDVDSDLDHVIQASSGRGAGGEWVGVAPSGASSSEQLLQQAEAIEEEIQANKRVILKSALKRERIQLLHRNLHGSQDSGGGGGGGVAGQGGVASGGSTDPDRMMLEEELTHLNQEIKSKKRKLLRVVKSMEEKHRL